MQARSFVLFTAFSAAAFVLLIGLGLWQLQRLEWKQGSSPRSKRAHTPSRSL